MPLNDSQLSHARYARAAAFLNASLATRLSGVVGAGYWIDATQYFYTVGHVDDDGIGTTTPMLADVALDQTAPVLTPESLASLIGAHAETAPTPAELAGADYDMPRPGVLVVSHAGVAYHIDLAGPSLTHADTIDMTPALYSPDGRWACVIKDNAVWLKDRESGVTEPLSEPGEPLFGFGLPLESGISALEIRKMPMPVPLGLWSEDSQWFATHRADERGLPDTGIVEHVPAGGGLPIAHLIKASSPNHEPARVEFAAFHVSSGRSVSAAARKVIAHVLSPFNYRQCWFAGEYFYFYDTERFSSEIALVELDLGAGTVRTVVSERAETGWLDSQPMVAAMPNSRVLPGSGEVIWYSDRDGRGHLYLYDLADGALKNRITEGAWMVRDVVHVDEARRRLLFLAGGIDPDLDPVFRSLCAINFDGTGFEVLISAGRDVIVRPEPVIGTDQLRPYRPSYAPMGVSPDGRYAAVNLADAETPTSTVLIELATGRELLLGEPDIDAVWRAPRPQAFEALAADGVTKLYGAMFLPSDFDPAKSYPLVDYVYPGPQLNFFFRRFPSLMVGIVQSVAELGVVGIVTETRGMPLRDRAFHQAGHGRMHEPQLADLVAVITQLSERHSFIDRERIGVFGQSGGGYASARAMFDYPDTFKVAVSVCGNHDNRNYIAHWLDKYGGRPGTPERDEQSNVEAAHRLRGKLFLVHGELDDNVHVAQTLAVSAALIEAGRPFDQLIVPYGNHGVLEQSPFVIQRLWDYFTRHLIGAEPPTDFKLEFDMMAAMAGLRLMASEIL